MKSTKSPTYYLALEMRFNTLNKGMKRRISIEEETDYSFTKRTLSHEETYVPEEITIVQKDMFRHLSSNGCKLVLQIISELHMNNALWYFDHGGKSQLKLAIADLRKAGILLRTEDSRIHFVNPDMIRRGSRSSVLSMTAAELQSCQRVTTDNIRALNNKKINFSPFDITQMQRPNLLGEP